MAGLYYLSILHFLPIKNLQFITISVSVLYHIWLCYFCMCLLHCVDPCSVGMSCIPFFTGSLRLLVTATPIYNKTL
ncbi:hypothetical protein V8E53_004893, partial [Lactarius tabidus]